MICLTNLHQIGLGVALYTHEWVVYPTDTGDGSKPRWVTFLAPYVENASIYDDPAAPDQAVDYGWNWNVGPFPDPAKYQIPQPEIVRDPAQLILCADSRGVFVLWPWGSGVEYWIDFHRHASDGQAMMLMTGGNSEAHTMDDILNGIVSFYN